MVSEQEDPIWSVEEDRGNNTNRRSFRFASSLLELAFFCPQLR